MVEDEKITSKRFNYGKRNLASLAPLLTVNHHGLGPPNVCRENDSQVSRHFNLTLAQHFLASSTSLSQLVTTKHQIKSPRCTARWQGCYQLRDKNWTWQKVLCWWLTLPFQLLKFPCNNKPSIVSVAKHNNVRRYLSSKGTPPPQITMPSITTAHPLL